MKYFLSCIAAAAAILLIIDPQAVSEAVKASAASCLEVVVPSLFAFAILAVYLQKSGLYRVALKPLTFPLSKLLRLDEELCAVFVLSNIGGYPVGVKLLSELTEQGRLSERDAGRMMCCCFGSGLGFVVGIVGLKIFGSAAAGLILFAACFAASLLIAAFVRARGEITLKKAENGFDLSAAAFISSVTGAAKMMFTVCAMIVGFSAITALLREVGIFGLFAKIFGTEDVFPALLEVTRISGLAATDHALPLCGALLSFGGVCVLMQVAALSNGIPLKGFIISRVPAALICAVITLPFSERFVSEDIEAIASETAVIPFTSNAALAVCVLAMSAILLIDAKRRTK